jgi:hypothetical protein
MEGSRERRLAAYRRARIQAAPGSARGVAKPVTPAMPEQQGEQFNAGDSSSDKGRGVGNAPRVSGGPAGTGTCR